MKKNTKLSNTYKDLWNKTININPIDTNSGNSNDYFGSSSTIGNPTQVHYDTPTIDAANTSSIGATAASKIPFLGGKLRYSKAGGISIGNSNGTGALNTVGNNLGKIATGINLAAQGYDLYNNIDSLSDAADNEETLRSKILSTAAANPMNSSYLSADSMNMLRQLRNGTYEADNVKAKDVILGGLGGALKGVLTGAAGGVPGMVIGGIGGAVNGGLSSKVNTDNAENQKLESLLSELEDARTQYNQMKRPNYNQMGLQSRYTDKWS